MTAGNAVAPAPLAAGAPAPGGTAAEDPAAGGKRIVRTAIRGQARNVVPAAVFSMIHQGCEAAVPVMIGLVVDQAISKHSAAGLGWTLLALAVLFAVLTVSMRLGGRLVRRATQGAAHELRTRLARRVLDPRGIDLPGLRSGELLSTATSDTQRVGMVNAAVWGAAGAAGALIVAAVLLLRASLLLGLLVILGLIPVFLLTTLISKPLVHRSSVEQAAAARASGVATDLVRGLRVLAGIGAEAAAAARYAAASMESRTAAVRSLTLIAVRTGVITALNGGFLALVAWVGGRLTASGTISVGDFVAAIGLTQFLIGPFGFIANVGAGWARASASARRVSHILDAPYAVGAGTAEAAAQSPDVPGDGVRLDVTGLRRGALRGLDLSAGPGELLGVLIDEPAAATALVACLGREAEPEAGDITCGGVPLAGLAPTAARASVLVSGHDAALFSGTVIENVTAGTSGGGRADSAVARAVECADVDSIAASLPEGLDTPVTERGRSLSGGERQRVLLARALAAEPPVLVLHDPTTAVDTVTEARIAAGIRTMRAARTTLVITTSPALLAAADRVVVVRHGRAELVGTHAELLESDAYYRTAVLG
ncbi:ABC transporter ATP-binding protein [Streptomyces sp. CA-111067]|uniref:ABC transporter ATP-binding protein n=1 Tax=Streptomyces sp. CA-111067 TaxID=3240046 RepID=UPI003D9798F6